jgi:hypothetical protein
MSNRYFDKFPIITYSNNQVVDITRRVTLLEKVSRNPYIFYPYTIENQERPDQLSDRYYNDSYKSWLIYQANKIMDPYYEWYMSNDEFYEFLEKKYDSVYKAQNKTKFYRNDWENKDNISKSDYNALPFKLKKYWYPNYSSGSSILDYSRKEVDWMSNTNKIISYTVSNTSFTNDEICNIVLADGYIGKGQVISTTDTNVYLQHVYGSYFTNIDLPISASSYIYGTESNCNTVITADPIAISNNISEEELVYWKPITYHDYESEKNEYNKTVRLIDSSQSDKAVENVRVLLEQ